MTKKEMEEMVQVYKDQAQLYREQYLEAKEQMSKLQEQVFRLQDGLMSVRAPEAYRDYRVDNMDEPAIDPELIEKQKKLHEIHGQYIHQMEQPIFTSADDMMSTLGGALWANQDKAGKSLHNNDES